MTTLNLIKWKYPSMSPVEKRIADFILSDPERAMYSTVVFVAKNADVSEGSVVNFATSLGYAGFSQLKINLIQQAAEQVDQRADTSENLSRSIMREMIDRATESFESTFESIGKEIDDAADAFLKAKKIIIVGMGHTKCVANDLEIRMTRIGLPTRLEPDPLLAGISIAQLSADDVVFALSSSGRTKDVIAASEIAKQVSAKLVCLTSYDNSPLAKMSDIKLVAVSLEAQTYREATTARLTQLLIGDCLIDTITRKMGEDAIVYMDKMVEIYEKNRETIKIDKRGGF